MHRMRSPTAAEEDPTKVWHKTACVLLLEQLRCRGAARRRKITRVRGDKEHPASKGYTCEKALRIDYYQNGRDRLTTPLRRRDDGTFEEVSWDVAIAEVAERLTGIRDSVGGDQNPCTTAAAGRATTSPARTPAACCRPSA